MDDKKDIFLLFEYGLEPVRFLVICLALLGVILLAALVVILFANLLRELCSQWYYIRLVTSNARSAYHLRSKYHAFMHITRLKANITEKRYFEEFTYEFEPVCFLVICLAMLGVILLVSLVVISFPTLTVILYSPCNFQRAKRISLAKQISRIYAYHSP